MTDDQIAELGARAADCARRGDRVQATSLWHSVLTARPGEPRALNFLGNAALNGGDPAAAVNYLTRAVEAEPGEPAIHYNLALALNAARNSVGAMATLTAALKIDPYFLPALLLKGQIFEAAGELRAAAQAYDNVLKCVGDTVIEQPSLARQVAHARTVVAQESLALTEFLDTGLATSRAAAAVPDQARFDACVDVLTKRRKVYYPAPTFLNYPGLPVTEFFDTAQFDWVAGLEAQADVIAGECASLLRDRLGDFAAYVTHPDGAPLNQWADLNNNPDWSAFYLWRDGVRQDANCAACPHTAAALAQVPRADVPGRAPTAFFSVLRPRTHIPPHTGVTNTRVIVHLPLIIPDACWFRVGAQTRRWQPGEILIFDDSIEHEAMNDSDAVRAVLIFDIWNPHMSAGECALVAELVQKYGEFYGTQAPAYGNA